ncbi:MAG TPA: dienelactone hydrolase family protein [Chryseosolibacter sp.]
MKNIREIFSLVAFATLLATSVVAQTSSNGSIYGFNYLEVVKGDGKTALPLLIAFHFSSSSPTEVLRYFDSLSFPVRIIVPRGNYPKRGGYSYFPRDHYSNDTLTQMRTVQATVDSVAMFVKHFHELYNTKPIVSGISQGGDISLLLAINYPELIKASFPLLGFVHRAVYENLSKPAVSAVPIFLYHGADDKIVSSQYVKKEFQFLKQKFNIESYFYPKVEHDVTPAMEKDYSKKMMLLVQH